MEQSQVERLLRMKAANRRPNIEAALAKLERKLARKAEYLANAQMRAERKIAAMEKLVKSYREDLAYIDAGTYRGYNGKPFGATPTVVEGLV